MLYHEHNLFNYSYRVYTEAVKTFEFRDKIKKIFLYETSKKKKKRKLNVCRLILEIPYKRFIFENRFKFCRKSPDVARTEYNVFSLQMLHIPTYTSWFHSSKFKYRLQYFIYVLLYIY